jgi:hypothetical protein
VGKICFQRLRLPDEPTRIGFLGKQTWPRGTAISSPYQRNALRSSQCLDAFARTASDRKTDVQGILEVEPSMSERENIFGRIREALRVPAPIPEAHDHERLPHAVSEAEAAKHISEWLPAVGETFEERVELFRANALELKARFLLLGNAQELEAHLRELAIDENWKTIASHSGEMTDPACAALGLPRIAADQTYDVNELERCDVGISECDALWLRLAAFW